MLGRFKRTTRLDVGLALSFTGVAYLVWALVAGISRAMMFKMIQDTSRTGTTIGDLASQGTHLPELTKCIKLFFVDTGFVIDIVGLAWMLVGLLLVVLANRQKISISWAWLSNALQAIVATVGAMLVAVAVFAPYGFDISFDNTRTLETLSQISLPVVMGFALLIWIFVIWLLITRAARRGPSLNDGMRTNR